MEKLVVSLDIAKQLKAAGFPQETVFHWSHWQGKKSGIEEWHISGGWGWSNHTLPSGRTHHYYHEDSLAAPTAQELADVLPGRTWVGLFTEYAAKNEIGTRLVSIMMMGMDGTKNSVPPWPTRSRSCISNSDLAEVWPVLRGHVVRVFAVRDPDRYLEQGIVTVSAPDTAHLAVCVDQLELVEASADDRLLDGVALPHLKAQAGHVVLDGLPFRRRGWGIQDHRPTTLLHRHVLLDDLAVLLADLDRLTDGHAAVVDNPGQGLLLGVPGGGAAMVQDGLTVCPGLAVRSTPPSTGRSDAATGY
jgi:hypothetical protein